MQRFNASRSADPRVTGKLPSAVRNTPMGLIFHIESLPMYIIRRRVVAAATGMSNVDRWLGAKINVPDFGILCASTIRKRR